MMELIIIIVVTALILAVVAFVVLGTVITTMPWFAWVLIVAIICGFQYMRHLQKYDIGTFRLSCPSSCDTLKKTGGEIRNGKTSPG